MSIAITSLICRLEDKIDALKKEKAELVAVAKMALRTYERHFPNGQGVIDLRAALAKAGATS